MSITNLSEFSCDFGTEETTSVSLWSHLDRLLLPMNMFSLSRCWNGAFLFLNKVSFNFLNTKFTTTYYLFQRNSSLCLQNTDAGSPWELNGISNSWDFLTWTWKFRFLFKLIWWIKFNRKKSGVLPFHVTTWQWCCCQLKQRMPIKTCITSRFGWFYRIY